MGTEKIGLKSSVWNQSSDSVIKINNLWLFVNDNEEAGAMPSQGQFIIMVTRKTFQTTDKYLIF